MEMALRHQNKMSGMKNMVCTSLTTASDRERLSSPAQDDKRSEGYSPSSATMIPDDSHGSADTSSAKGNRIRYKEGHENDDTSGSNDTSSSMRHRIS